MAKLKSSARKGSAGAGAKRPGTGGTSAESLQSSIMESAQQIWLAGVGAFARAQQEGTRLFETLVKEGEGIEQKTRRMATGRVDAVRDAVESRVGQVRERAADTWDRLEQVFEQRVQRALNRLGVPGREELQELNARVDELTREVRKLAATGGAAGKAAKAAPRKAAAPARKTAKKAAKKTSREGAAKAPPPASRSSGV